MTGHAGRWFEELPVGFRIDHPVRRTITESDNVTFSTMTMNPAAVHLDYHAAAASGYGRPLVNSILTLGIVVGLSVHDLTHGTTVANLGFTDVRFPAPVFIGDTVSARSEVVEARPSSSQADRGLVTFRHQGVNHDGILVCECIRTALMMRRPQP